MSDSQFAAVSQSIPPRPRRWRRRAFWLVSLALLAAACAIWLLDRPALSPAKAVALIRERRALAPSDDAASAIEQIASQILSPESLAAALRESAEPPHAKKTLAAEIESLRSRLRVEVDPGAGRQPWTISIRSEGRPDGGDDTPLVNRLAKLYAQAREAAELAKRQRSLEAARTASQRAERMAEQSLHEFDRQIDRLAQLAAAPRAQSTEPQADAAQAPANAPPQSENAEQRAELESRVAELQAQRATILERLLPAHPEVLALDEEIDMLLVRLDQLPPETASPSAEQPTEPRGAPPRAKDLPDAEAKRALASLRSRRKSLADAISRGAQLAADERLAADRMLHGELDEIVVLSPAAAAPRAPALGKSSFIAVICSAGLLAAWALGRRRQHASDAFRDIDDLESALGVPLIGVLEAC